MSPAVLEERNKLMQPGKYQEARVVHQSTNSLRRSRAKQRGSTLSTWDGLCIDQKDEVSGSSRLLSAYALLVYSNKETNGIFS